MSYFDLNLDLSPEDEAIKDAARRFALEVLRPASIVIDKLPDDADYSAAQQLSFLLEGLDELRQMRDSLVVNGTEVDRYACHGNAWSIYFHDPEGNYLELYAHTPWYIPQPYGLPFDLDQTNEEIMRSTEQLCRENPGFMMETERKAKARQTMLD